MTKSLRTALLVVDVQVGAFDGVRRPALAEPRRLLDVLCSAIVATRMSGGVVVIVQDDGAVGGAFELGTPHGEVHPEIAPSHGDWHVVKEASSAFAGTGLANRLRAARVHRVLVGGLHSEYCVTATCQAALEHGFRVDLLRGGHVAAGPGGEEAVEAALARCGVGAADG